MVRVVSEGLAAWVFCLVVLCPARGQPCTTFLTTTQGRHVVGKSYDWHIGQGHVIINKRGVRKRSILLRPGASPPTQWVSQHASVTFNQYGREMPNGGMNDAGLVVEVMWLDSTLYPNVDDRPALNELQWIQYQLDNHRSVADMVAHAARLRVEPAHAKVHYLACDRTPDCAVFEYLDGKLVVTHGPQLVAKALTNNTYGESLEAFREHQSRVGEKPLPLGKSSLARFVRASHLAGNGVEGTGNSVDAAFAILDNVSAGAYTKWNIAYDLDRLRAYFRTTKNRRIKHVDLTSFAGGCSTPTQWLDVDADLEGPVGPAFRDWSTVANRRLVTTSLLDLKAPFPPQVVERMVEYPSKLPCVDASSDVPPPAAGRP